VYGGGADGRGESDSIVLQARKSIALVVRGPGGAVYFARVLKPGEAWRAPSVDGLSVDVGQPGAVEVFVGGLSRGRLIPSQASLSKLAEP
jgi:hypothetical protein